MPGKPFQKGQSGNPGGRVKGIERQLRELLGNDLPKIAEAMKDIALCKDAKHSDRIKAAEFCYDRCYGKPRQVVDHFDGGASTLDIESMTNEELEKLIRDGDAETEAETSPSTEAGEEPPETASS